VARDEAYEKAKTQAFAFLEKGFHLGAERVTDRADLYER
jgi:hypothetical protein